MNKVLIVSDSHGLTEELLEIKARHQVDYMIHCGDSELEMDSTALKGFYKVRGNCDMDNRFPNEQLIELNGVKFLIVHGHEHNVNRDLTTLSYTGEEKGASVICYGHTHTAGVKRYNQQLLINPGSIRSPRGITEKTYAILKWNSLEKVEVNYYNIQGQHYEALNYKTDL